MSSQANSGYYVPHGTHWPIVGSIGLFLTMMGFANLLNGHWNASVMLIGMAVVIVMMFGWFGTVIRESRQGYYNTQVDTSFRWGMGWFIFSEVMFFAAFFGALFYARELAGPWLAGMGTKFPTHELLWPHFEFSWPSNGPAHIGGEFEPMSAWWIPTFNTLVLLTSGATLTWAHWGLLKENRRQLIIGVALTVALGFLFVFMQAHEYIEAYTKLNMKLDTGIYGATFFMLTGFHGMHVIIGATMLTVLLVRCIRGHFSPQHHFAFEAISWYWHFVDVVWLGLYIFVYVLA